MAMDNGLDSTLAELEERCLKMIKGNWLVLMWCTILALLPSAYLYYRQTPAIAYLAIAVLFAVVATVIISSRRSKMAVAFKQEAIPVLLDTIAPGFHYHGGVISLEEFNKSGLFIRPDRYNGKDLMGGVVGKTQARFSMVHAEERYETERTETDNEGRTRKVKEVHWRTIFQGLFFSADFNKHFKGRTCVRAGGASVFSKLFGNLVKLEDPRFNKLFTVTSTDQVEARYILTPRMLERIVELREKLGGIEISFVESRICIAIRGMSYSTFEPNLRRPFTDPERITGTLGTLLMLIGIVEDLDLNTRIWTKQ
jgi:hypothetical protein